MLSPAPTERRAELDLEPRTPGLESPGSPAGAGTHQPEDVSGKVAPPESLHAQRSQLPLCPSVGRAETETPSHYKEATGSQGVVLCRSLVTVSIKLKHPERRSFFVSVAGDTLPGTPDYAVMSPALRVPGKGTQTSQEALCSEPPGC